MFPSKPIYIYGLPHYWSNPSITPPQHYPSLNPSPRMDDDIYSSSDEFHMYKFKIKRCRKNHIHDWTNCPFTHLGEKARRRDPRMFSYVAITCPEFRVNSTCHRGDACFLAHGVFEYWMHPARYRTRYCASGMFCLRKVCFFAHGVEELRPETRYRVGPGKIMWTVDGSSNGGGGIIWSETGDDVEKNNVSGKKVDDGGGNVGMELKMEFLESLRKLKMKRDQEKMKRDQCSCSSGGGGGGSGREDGCLTWEKLDHGDGVLMFLI